MTNTHGTITKPSWSEDWPCVITSFFLITDEFRLPFQVIYYRYLFCYWVPAPPKMLQLPESFTCFLTCIHVQHAML